MVLRERSSIGAGDTERGDVRVFYFWGFQVMASPSRFHSHLLLTQSKGRVWREFAKIMQTVRTCTARVIF